MECLENLIGLTESTCECHGLDAGGFEDLNASTSGLYVTDQDGGYPLLDAVTASIDCNSPDNVLQVLTKARTAAVEKFATDVAIAMRPRYAKGANFRGFIGKPLTKAVQRLPGTATVAGLELVLPIVRGQSLVIDHIHTGFPAGGDVVLSVWGSDPAFVPPAPITLTGQPGKFTRHALDTPLVLPQTSHTGLANIYRFYYTVASAPYGNALTCCGVKPDYNGHFRVAGFTGTDPEHYEPLGSNSLAYGLSLEGYSTCDVTGWLCETDQLGEYDLKRLQATAIRYQAAINLMHFVLSTGNLNYYSLFSTEATYGRRNAYQKSYTGIVDWIAQNVPVGAVGCLGCKRGIVQATTTNL